MTLLLFGRFCGGFSRKIHAVCDALSQSIRFILTRGEVLDYTQALMLLQGLKVKAVLADKGCDAAEVMGSEVVSPARSNRKKP